MRPFVSTAAVAFLSLAGFANAQFFTEVMKLPMIPETEFPTIDGSDNNIDNPEWGKAHGPFLRLSTADYGDGLGTPAGDSRPSARAVSNAVHDQIGSIENRKNASSYLWQWGQFLDHDITETPLADPAEPFSISVPQGDIFFDPFNTGTEEIGLTRSNYVLDSNSVRQQINEITSFIDASNVYGSTVERNEALRIANDPLGRMKTSRGNLLPFNVDGLPNAMTTSDTHYLAGDVRANEQIALTAMHTMWVREHNQWCLHIFVANFYQYFRYVFYSRVFPEMAGDPIELMTGDEIYEKSRRIVSAEMQAITYNEFLPMLLGDAMPSYSGYDPDLDPSINNVFSTAAYRIGHTMLPQELLRLTGNGNPVPEGNIALLDAFFSPETFQETSIEAILMGLAYQKSQAIDPFIVDDVRNFLFGPPGAGGFDLASLNIQRGRDHGLPSYNQLRQDFGLQPVSDFSEISVDPRHVGRLQSVYDSVDDIDAWTGLLSEDLIPGALVGDTMATILAQQFIALREGDRFYYENTMSPDFIRFINKQTLATVIARNTQLRMSDLRENVFIAMGERVPPLPDGGSDQRRPHQGPDQRSDRRPDTGPDRPGGDDHDQADRPDTPDNTPRDANRVRKNRGAIRGR